MKNNILFFCTAIMAIMLAGCQTNTFDSAYTGKIDQQTTFPVPTPDEAVDLGLSVKWAPFNIGAAKASDFGNYYAYGEVDIKNSYSSDNYIAPNHKNSFDNIIATESDAATVAWGENWRMPTSEEIEELRSLQRELVIVNGVKGLKITGLNGNSIFLPAAGIYTQDKLYEHNNEGFYRNGTGTRASVEYFNIPDNEYYGCSIRPVLAIGGEQNDNIYIPEEEDAVDLGLSVKWAPVNIGANNYYEFGNYYSYSEVEPKSFYSENNYSPGTDLNCEGRLEGGNSDVAYIKWGGNWRMPTEMEYNELINSCKISTEYINGVCVSKLTGPNGNVLYLPNNGYCEEYKIVDKNKASSRHYWSSSNDSNSVINGFLGMGIRPVLSSSFTNTDNYPVPSKEEAVDLGLSVNWAPYNLGASKETQAGNFYAWGETEFKAHYCSHNYTTPSGVAPADNIAGTKHDAANVKWGNGWRMPTIEELNELWTKCYWNEEVIDGVKGFKITSMNGNSIFLPYYGIINYREMQGKNQFAGYNIANSDKANLFESKFVIPEHYYGALIRPVIVNENSDESETENDIVDVSFDNMWENGFRREWWQNVFEHEIYIGCTLNITLNNESVSGITDYGIILYYNNIEVSTISHQDSGTFTYPEESATTSAGSIMNTKSTNGYPQISIKATDKDFFFNYVDGTYLATLGKGYRYKTYYKKLDINNNEIQVTSQNTYPLSLEYKRQPSVSLISFGTTTGEENNGNVSLHYEYTARRNGVMFLDTLYSVNSFYVKSSGKHKIVKKDKLQAELLADGYIGYGMYTGYNLSDYPEYDYKLYYWEGILRKGNNSDTLRSNPIVFDFHSHTRWILECPEEWPEEFIFWKN